ncbi:trypsin-like peptidase domain-containing protein [Vibrio parahaemolyticus]|uniref:trypsin-like peptidase domain-containing protein n=2 Tax=Vibrio parahaemolyticus TaxID=670 RepID=UPI000428C1D0|nr:trypsin-like peptidase domain-containing protein [Vibrio parahaemolyticus]EJE8536058.1 trypsin-like peptidase domain-containing protein [Vibrio vulnificus]EKA7361470.1 trypsin-like peptidase domain-containing protein [Vibrio parahaemolyticus]EKB1992558.1 trypsin-like peptidase domain-containing protein [Vibrio parahaemolyticus]EME0136044.1 trypsin-like peptidase domain-containing protein [Vibrio parahaemolyticus]MCQ9044371.1 trypsin-like peptidase domain-containing protein [Vibrio parahaemo
MGNIPVSTQWTLDAAGETGRSSVESVYMIVCPATGSKGSGFLIEGGLIVTNEHVVSNCNAHQITAVSAFGEPIAISQVWIDKARDLAILRPSKHLAGGLELATSTELSVGESVVTWGYPLGYNGPAPLLSVGYLAGFQNYQLPRGNKKHLVVNGAFNSGNSGGALFRASDNKVIGIVVSKHAPISQYHQNAIDVLAENSSGVCFTYTDEHGNQKSFVESQIVADLLVHMRSLTQVMIGEAIAVEELIALLSEIDTSEVDSKSLPSRNAPCICGSGQRYKNCCGKIV